MKKGGNNVLDIKVRVRQQGVLQKQMSYVCVLSLLPPKAQYTVLQLLEKNKRDATGNLKETTIHDCTQITMFGFISTLRKKILPR